MTTLTDQAEWLHPVLDISMRAPPPVYREVEGDAGRAICVEVSGEAGR